MSLNHDVHRATFRQLDGDASNGRDCPRAGAVFVTEIQTNQLPEFYELHEISKSEHSNLHIIWVNLALEYYKIDILVAFVKLLELSHSNSSLLYKDSDKYQIRALDMLAAYCVQTANGIRIKIYLANSLLSQLNYIQQPTE